MARNYRHSGHYRMTPARKAALRKAQLASAKKRKRRQIAGAVVGAGVLGGAAYAGYKHGHKGADIARDMRSRTPKNVRGVGSKVRAAFQPLAKERTRIMAGLTKGVHRGAGPNAGQAKPAPKPRQYKRIVIPQVDASTQQAIQDKADGVVREKWIHNGKIYDKVRKLGPEDRKRYDSSGSLIERPMRGLRWKSAKKMSQAIDLNQSKKAVMGAQALDKVGRQELFGRERSQGNAYGRYQDSTQRSKNRVRRIKRNQRLRKKRAANELKFRNNVMDQWLQDFPDG